MYKEAQNQQLTPNDRIELIPFLQAFAYLGDKQQVKQLSTIINSDDWYELQACQVLNGMSESGYGLQADMQEYVDGIFCKGAK